MTHWAVLSGGGAFGAFQARVLRNLSRRGHGGYDGIAGISVGAINGALIQQFDDFEEGASMLWSMWEGLNRRDVWRHHIPLGPIHGAWTPNLVNTGPLHRLVARHFSAPVPTKKIQVGAFGVGLRQMRWWSETDEDLRDGVLASSAFPVMFAPVNISGHQWIDGGVHTVTPLARAIELGAERIDVIFTGSSQPSTGPASVRWAGGIASESFLALIDGVQRKDLKVADLYNRLARVGAAGEKRVVEINRYEPDEPLPGGPLDFDPDNTKKMAEVADRVAQP